MLPSSIGGSAQITDGLTSLFLEITVATVFIILVARFLRPVQSHTPNANEAKLVTKPSTEDKRPPKELTLRIDDVPAETPQALLEKNLKSITDRPVDDLRSALDGLIIRSLVRRDNRFSCATVAITTSLPEERILKALQDCLKSRGFLYRCDCNFYGITPLYEGEGNADYICEYAEFTFSLWCRLILTAGATQCDRSTWSCKPRRRLVENAWWERHLAARLAPRAGAEYTCSPIWLRYATVEE